MDIKNVKKFIELAKSEGVAELKYEEKEFKVSVSFNSTASPVSHIQVPAQSITPQSGSTAEIAVDKSLHEVKSPFVGTFYASPSPDKPNYVSVGNKVSAGQTLCILEAMKIMNEIESDASGEIVEVCVDNESLVEYGQVLYRIRV